MEAELQRKHLAEEGVESNETKDGKIYQRVLEIVREGECANEQELLEKLRAVSRYLETISEDEKREFDAINYRPKSMAFSITTQPNVELAVKLKYDFSILKSPAQNGFVYEVVPLDRKDTKTSELVRASRIKE